MSAQNPTTVVHVPNALSTYESTSLAGALTAADGFYRIHTVAVVVRLLIVEVAAAVLNIGINLGPDFPGRSTISILLIVIAFGAVAMMRPF